ncbi:MAG TPA: T9SS type A sorting domain-containing protein [Bacteroidales bacterium]|nr:T9SS type A sorting domain-containing protein [Bacteroidales bacterium]
MKFKHLLFTFVISLIFFNQATAQNTFPGIGDVGIGTTSPNKLLHLSSGDTPTVRLEQNGSAGWTPHTWDVSANEANFFIRDVTQGNALPFRIKPGAPTSSLTIQSTGYVGVGTWYPSANLDVNGTIKIGYTSLTPQGGMIHFQDTIFEGFDGSRWRSFTSVDSAERVSIVSQSVDSAGLKLAALDTAFNGQTQHLQNQIDTLKLNDDSTAMAIASLSNDLENKTQHLQGQLDTVNSAHDSLVAKLMAVNDDRNNKIQDLQDQIDALTARLDAMSTSSATVSTPQSTLLQNRPNPFNENTVIDYHLTGNTQHAVINVYDMSGKPLLSYPLSGKPDGTLKISADKLGPGMYFYSLIVNGKAVASKKMVIPEK